MQSNSERRAWRILLSFFAVFVLLCAGAVYFVQWYIFQSTVPLDLDLIVARGTVRIILPNTQQAIAVTDQRSNIEAGTVIQTDEKSQAILTFTDSNTGQPIATLVVFRDSQVSLIHASAPRFKINNAPYRIEVNSSAGRDEISVLPGAPRPTYFEVLSPQASTHIAEDGQYSFEITDQRTGVTVRSGQALVIQRDTGQNVTLLDHSRVAVGTSDNPMALPAERSLLTNSDFTQAYQIGWELYNDGEPTGTAQNVTLDGRSAVVLDRSQANWPGLTLGHGETGLVQSVEANVSTFSSLELRATFFVDEQSLALCGRAGSECPLMIRVAYRDMTGTDRVYIHGFYATPDTGQGYPLLCDTCRTEHERIAAKSWYTYSENLIALLPAEQRPAYIKEIRFYASGWAYKVYVSEMNLLGVEAPPTPSP